MKPFNWTSAPHGSVMFRRYRQSTRRASTLHYMHGQITSVSNDTVKAVARLKRGRERRRTAQILVEGPNLFGMAIAAGLVPTVVLMTSEDSETARILGDVGVAPTLVADHVLASVADAVNPRSPVAVFDRPESAPFPEGNIVVLVDVADPGNAGTIIRSAAAFGWAVGYTPGTVDLWSPKTLRSGVGAHFSVSLLAVGDVASAFAASPHTVVATVVGGGETTLDIESPVALLVGSEAHGLREELGAIADVRMTIPMPGGFESLNAGVAASIAMFSIA